MENKDNLLLNDDKEIKVDVKNDNMDEDYSDDFYDRECECGCGCHYKECDCKDCNCDECGCEDCNHACCHKCDENILDDLIDEFTPLVVERGEEYYDNGNVLQIRKNNNTYYAKVEGHDGNVYDVTIETYDDGDYNFECDCPCDYPCKHIYATLIGISEGEYNYVDLKENISFIHPDMQKIIENINAEDLKKYVLNNIHNICFNMSDFKDHFRKYFPRQEYDYYYNGLYNCIKLNNCHAEKIDYYMDLVGENVSKDCFKEAFDILKSIIEVLHDTDTLNSNGSLFELLNKMGMFFRIIYRKGDEDTKLNLRNYAEELKNKNYYDNYYLEDAMLSLK